MKTLLLLDSPTFKDKRPNAEPLFIGETGRVLRFTLKPGQELSAHRAPSSPVHIVVLQGCGLFSGEDGREQPLGPNSMVVYEADELHRVRALDQKLVFVALLHPVSEQPIQHTESDHSNDHYLTWHM